MNAAEHDRNHELLCAWILGETSAEETREVEQALAASPALRAERERLEQTIHLVQDSYSGAAKLPEEAMAQATGLLAFYSLQRKPEDGVMYYLVGVDKARFKRPVEPGDQLRVEVQLQRRIRDIYRFSGVASVDGVVVSTAEFMTTKMEVDR